MKKLKILRIIARLNIGGPAIHAVLLTKEFNDNEFESVLMHGAISNKEGDMGYIAKRYGVNPVYVAALKREINPFLDIAALWGIFSYMRHYKPDIVHTHTAKAGTLGRIAAILAGVPVKVHTFHGNIFYGYFGSASTRFFIFMERFLAKFTNVIIAISTLQKNEIVQRYRIIPAKKCRVVRLGFDLERFLISEQKKGIFRNKLEVDKDDILIGIIGRLVSIKNHKMFIDAAGHVMKNVKGSPAEKIRFVIVGDGELKEELLIYADSKGFAKKIFFTGWNKDMDEVYADLDIVTLTSINEGTPVSLIEAMASSKPVIATDAGGTKDALGNVGLLVPSGDYRAMGDKMLELVYSEEKRRELGERGRNFVKNIYSKKRLVRKIRELYKELFREQIGGEI